MQENISTFQSWSKEQEFLEQQKKSQPELFKSPPHLGSRQLLAMVGVQLDGTNLPLGYIKYSPFDFVVEEIQQDGKIVSLNSDPINNTMSSNDPGSKTVYADLIKMGLSGFDAIKELSGKLKIDKENIGIAGLKDALALTAQKISIRGSSLKAVEDLEFGNILLKNIYLAKGVIAPGSLKGNRFTILVRTQSKVDQEFLDQELAELEENGFWNFYGVQRFGSRFISHLWGRNILRQEYEELVHSYFCEQGIQELPYFKMMRKEAENNFGDWKKIQALFGQCPYTFRFELILLEHLIRSPKDYLGALKTMPEQVRFWLYAYASFLANLMISYYGTHEFLAPDALPLIYSNLKEDREIYSDLLKSDKVSLKLEKSLQPFGPLIRFTHREIPVRIKIEVRAAKILDEGVILSFDLPKGAYATTFLEHIFTLVSGTPLPEWLSTKEFDLKELTGSGTLKEYFERFKDHLTINSKESASTPEAE